MRLSGSAIVSGILLLQCTTLAFGAKAVSLEKLRIRTQIPGWVEEKKSYKAFTTKSLFDIINGGATEYIDNGMQKGIFQQLNNSDSSTIDIFAEDFGSSENAQKMLSTKQPEATADTSMFIINEIIGGFWVCGRAGQFYFELTLMGIKDLGKARIEIDKLFDYYNKSMGTAKKK